MDIKPDQIGARSYKFINAVLALFLLAPAVRAADELKTTEQEAQLPNIEFLEFLGSFETDAGEWVNPDDLLSTEFGLLLDTAHEEEDTNSLGDIENESDNNGNQKGSSD
ncbi:MAG: hypothetical protein JKY98_08355 [Gammaproteobacteria bacterium]|nr:hypothetical protein [Gammaproteobacteria bacterium]